VALKLTASERKAVLHCPYVMDSQHQDRIRQTSPNKPIPYTLEELEELHGNLAFDANHTEDARYEKKLDKILHKIERLLDTYTDQPQLVAQTPPQATNNAPMICGSEEVPVEFRKIYLELVALTDEFCNELLDVEYQQLCRDVAVGLCQPGSPVVRGKRISWASGIVYSVGWVNFLGDPNTEPHLRSEEIAEWFGISTGTMLSKSKIIREGLDILQLDPSFTLPSRLGDNPLAWMLEVNGFILDIRSASREAQEVAFEQGLIPYIPADQDETESPYAVVHQRVQPSNSTSKPRSQATAAAFQIKVTLNGSKPPIWRRLRVPDCTLNVLHEIIQSAMGWQNYHMHEFCAGDERFVAAEMEECGDFDEQARKECEVFLSELVETGHKTLRYWYDFGDDWWHTIKIEKTLEPQTNDRSPICLAGARACPPEDIGGIWGFVDFLEAMADPQHERHEELSEWYGTKFDPERFDQEEVNRRLAP